MWISKNLFKLSATIILAIIYSNLILIISYLLLSSKFELRNLLTSYQSLKSEILKTHALSDGSSSTEITGGVMVSLPLLNVEFIFPE